MELLTMSVITLLALYVIYSECIKLPQIIKKNTKLSYGLIIGLYLYYYQNNDVEAALFYESKDNTESGTPIGELSLVFAVIAAIALIGVAIVLRRRASKKASG